jgi:hypothetical protein
MSAHEQAERMTLVEFMAKYADEADGDSMEDKVEDAVYEGELNCGNSPPELTRLVEDLEEFFADAWVRVEPIADEARRLIGATGHAETTGAADA